jgi:hypothetical protein
MKVKIILIQLFMLSVIPLSLNAQQVNTLYFMEGVPVRHFLNPSFQPVDDFYLSLPVIGYTQFSIGNNSLSLHDVIYNVNGQTVLFLNPLGSLSRFYNTLNTNTLIQTDFQTNLLSFGFRNKSVYWTFSLTEKIDGTINLPKDLFKISLFGTSDSLSNSFNLSKLESNISVYTEAALGYSKQLNDKWTLGGKLKLLLGSANVSNSNNSLLLDAGVDKWKLKGEGTVGYSGPVQINNTGSNSYSVTMPKNISDLIIPSGIGAGMDLGCEYHLNDNITLSGSINDLGFIRWTGNTHYYQYNVDYSFSGVNLFENNSTIKSFQDVYNKLILGNGLADTLINAFSSSKKSKLTTNPYTTATTAKTNLAFEYSILDNKLSFGILSYSRLIKSILIEEITGSVNARPNDWLNTTLSYSINNGRFSTLGAGLEFETGMFNWFVAADYIPFQTAKLALSDLNISSPKMNIPIPYNSSFFNFSVGMNIVINNKKKATKKRDRLGKRQNCNCDWN